MIARSWRCRTDVRRADAFVAHLSRTGIAEARTTPGYRGHLLTSQTGAADGDVEFMLVTFWSDMEAIRRFAGAHVEVARRYAADEEFLVSADDHVVHATVVAADGPRFSNTAPGVASAD